MTRDDIAEYLHNQFAALEEEAGQGLFDDTEGYKLPIDATLRRLGVAESSIAAGTLADTLSEATYAVAEYHALRRFRFLIATRIDYPAEKMMARTQLFSQIDALLKEASERASTLGYGVVTASDYQFITLALDYLEPEAV
jgi:hypothetical protein